MASEHLNTFWRREGKGRSYENASHATACHHHGWTNKPSRSPFERSDKNHAQELQWCQHYRLPWPRSPRKNLNHILAYPRRTATHVPRSRSSLETNWWVKTTNRCGYLWCIEFLKTRLCELWALVLIFEYQSIHMVLPKIYIDLHIAQKILYL